MKNLHTQGALALEDTILRITNGAERALLMAEDLTDDYFLPLCEEVGKKDREAVICFFFEQNRIRAEILRDILFKMREAVTELNGEFQKIAP